MADGLNFTDLFNGAGAAPTPAASSTTAAAGAAIAPPKKRGRPPKDPNAPPKEKKPKPPADPNAPPSKGRGRPKGSKTDPSKLKDNKRKQNEAALVAGAEGTEAPAKKKRKDLNGTAVAGEAQTNGHVATPAAASPAVAAAAAAARRDFTEESTRRIANYETRFSKFQEAGTNFTALVDGKAPAGSSPFVSVTASFKVTVPPVAALYPLEGALAHYISPLLLTWHPQLNGILLAYNHAKLHTHPPEGSDVNIHQEAGQPMAQAVDECAAPYVWLTLEALVFRPRKGLEMEGHLTLQNESHITLILWNFFTVTISHKRIPQSWSWHESYGEGGEDDNQGNNTYANQYASNGYNEHQWGAWYDLHQNPVGGFLKFRIRDWDCAPPGSNGEGSFLSIEGSMLTDEEEEELKKTQEEQARLRRDAAARARTGTPLQGVLRKTTGSSAVGESTAATGAKKGRPKKNP